MSNAQNAFGGADRGKDPNSETWAYGRRFGRRGLGRWTAFEIIAVVLGLIVFWPIGLAILGYKLWQAKMGGPDLEGVVERGFRRARQTWSSRPASYRGWAPGTGNAAFDEWREGELARLEAERRKLEEAHREFAEFVANVRRAKDREEFERFMNERRAKRL
jgi:hypothetical protein